MLVNLPYNKTVLKVNIPDSRFKGIIKANPSAQVSNNYKYSQSQLVKESLKNPVDSPKLSQLVRGKNHIVIISSDHTRPVPEKIMMPEILATIKKGNPQAQVTILIATGTHRPTTKSELIEKFGKDIVENVDIKVHKSGDESNMVTIGKLPSGAVCRINKLAVEADLLIADGFIEPHFFAGYSGGRKAVFPGIAARRSVVGNHNGSFIDSKHSRTGILTHNPIHKDMIQAAKLAKLAFIVNVVLDSNKRIIGSFAGNPFSAHLKGTKFVDQMMSSRPIFSEITVTSNGGYPLDQNMYQTVKGLTGAEATNNDHGVIIMVAGLTDGTGGERFYNDFKNAKKISDIYTEALKTPAEKTPQDQWQSQILARVMMKHQVIIVSSPKSASMVRNMKMKYASSVDKALEMADEIVGKNASISVLPDGVSTIIKK